MKFRYRKPDPNDYGTQEKYEEALREYYEAEDDFYSSHYDKY